VPISRFKKNKRRRIGQSFSDSNAIRGHCFCITIIKNYTTCASVMVEYLLIGDRTYCVECKYRNGRKVDLYISCWQPFNFTRIVVKIFNEILVKSIL